VWMARDKGSHNLMVYQRGDQEWTAVMCIRGKVIAEGEELCDLPCRNRVCIKGGVLSHCMRVDCCMQRESHALNRVPGVKFG
jgi:hypothetical protein